jgi:N-acetylglucosamine transport system permease protein
MGRYLTYPILLFWLAAVVVPIAWVLGNSIRSSQEIYENSFGVPWLVSGSPYADDPSVPTPAEAAIKNYRTAWIDSGFADFFLNSVIVTGVSLALILGLGSLAAYALARFDFAWNKPLYLFFISGMMIPAQLVLIPLFFQYSWMGDTISAVLRPLGYEFKLHDTLTGLIIVYVAVSLPFTILLLTGFFKSLPGALREAAIIDGASEWTVFLRVMMPIARPGLVTAAIFNFLGIWNEYLFALVFVYSPEKKTLPLGLASISMQAQYKTDFGLMFAGLVIILIPTLVIYILLQRQLTRGITLGALKG